MPKPQDAVEKLSAGDAMDWFDSTEQVLFDVSTSPMGSTYQSSTDRRKPSQNPSAGLWQVFLEHPRRVSPRETSEKQEDSG